MSETPMPLWEVFIRNRSGLPHKHAGSVHARRRQPWRCRRRATSTRGAGRPCRSGWCRRARSPPPTRPHKDELFEPTASKIYRHPTFYEVPGRCRAYVTRYRRRERATFHSP